MVTFLRIPILFALLLTSLPAATLAEQLQAANDKNKALTATNLALTKADTKTRADIKAAISAYGTVQKSVTAFSARLDVVLADLTPVVTPPPPPPPAPTGLTDAEITTLVTDNTLAGVNKRLGPTAPAGMTLSSVWERPQDPTADVGEGRPGRSNFSDGLGVQVKGSARWDYSSSEANILHVSDVDLVLTPGASTLDPATAAGVGVLRLRTLEAADGVISEFPAVMWNGVAAYLPDDTSSHWVWDMKEHLGRPFAVARATINRYDIGFVLCDESRGGFGYVGVVGTQTAQTFWGQGLPPGKIPLSIAVSSQNEFLLVGVHDRATNKGQVLIYWMWAGNDLQAKQQGNGFPPDFRQAHPGLTNSGVITGMKLFATVDLPIKWPTSLACVCSPNTTGDRIEGEDGNAAYLSQWDLSTQPARDAFIARNGGWISSWGKACATSKYESKAVTIDLTALFAGVRAQYFTDDAGYQATRYPDPGNWWAAYDLNDPTKFPYGVSARPDWAPVVAKVIDVPTPTAMLLSEHGDAEIGTACADGVVRFFKWDGTADGSVKVGANPVYLSHDKYPGIRNGGLVVTCRGDRSVDILSTWGATASILLTVQDPLLLDPVAAEVNDTHNISMRLISVCDFGGKQLVNYRASKLVVPQDGKTFDMGPDGKALFERAGAFVIPGHPFALSDSNVN